MSIEDSIKRMEKLGGDGFVLSIAYGAMRDKTIGYSIQVMAPDGQCTQPFGANDFEHAIEIAEQEIKERGWSIQ